MRTRTTTIVASLVAAFALAAVGSLALAAGQADAYYLSSTTFSKWKYGDTHLNDMYFPQREIRFVPRMTRSVRLRAGLYDHGAYMVSMRHRTNADLGGRELSIPVTGRYKWVSTRRWRGPKTRFGHYEVFSTLSGHGVHQTVKNAIEPWVHYSEPSAVRYGNGKYEWGGRLARLCPGCTSPAG
jgi:hypothetical protein